MRRGNELVADVVADFPPEIVGGPQVLPGLQQRQIGQELRVPEQLAELVDYVRVAEEVLARALVSLEGLLDAAERLFQARFLGFREEPRSLAADQASDLADVFEKIGLVDLVQAPPQERVGDFVRFGYGVDVVVGAVLEDIVYDLLGDRGFLGALEAGDEFFELKQNKKQKSKSRLVKCSTTRS